MPILLLTLTFQLHLTKACTFAGRWFVQSVMPSTINQLNTDKGKLAMTDICSELFADITLIQEPHVGERGGVTFSSKTHNKFHRVSNASTVKSGQPNPRSMIIYSKNINVTELPHLTTADTTAVIWETNNKNCPFILVCSAYLDQHDDDDNNTVI